MYKKKELLRWLFLIEYTKNYHYFFGKTAVFE